MITIDTILASDMIRDARDIAICELIGLPGPGGYAVREPDGRLLVWASEADSIDDDGARATYRSAGPISDEAWRVIGRLAWIGDSEAI